MLDEGERVEADDGYLNADPQFAKTRSGVMHPEEARAMRNTLRARHETVNGRMKIFKMLSIVWRHSLEKHSIAFHAVAVITQLELRRSPLFEVEYYDSSINDPL